MLKFKQVQNRAVYFFFSSFSQGNTLSLLIQVIAFTYKDTESVLQNC